MVASGGRQLPAVGAVGEGDDLLGVGRCGGHQRADQAVAGLGGGREPVRGQAQLYGQPGLGVGEVARAVGEVPGDGVVALPGDLGAGPHGAGGGDPRHHHEGGEQGDEVAQAAGAAPGGAVGGGLGRQARVQEGLFRGARRSAQSGGPAGGEVAGEGEPGPAVEGSGVPPEAFPGPGGVGEAAVQPEALAVVGQPAAQPGPGADERLVGELDAAVVQGEQAQPGGAGEDGRGVGVPAQFLAGDGALGVLRALAEGDEVDEDLLGEAALTPGEGGVQGFGGLGERALESARGAEAVEGQGGAAAAAPGL